MRGSILAAGLLAMSMAAGAADAADEPWTLHAALGAPSNFSLSGSTRLRYETIGGQVRPGFGGGENLWAIRTIVSAEYRSGPFRIGGELDDSRVYGADHTTVLGAGDVNALEPVQAYVGADFKDTLGKGSSLGVQLGRMALNIGSRRLVAADEYRNTTNGYTGVKFDAKAPGGWSSTLIYVAPQTRLPDDLASLRRNAVRLDHEGDDQLLWGGVIAKTLPGAGFVEVQYFGLDERDVPARPGRNRDLDSFGLRFFRAPASGEFDWDVEGIRQVGHARSSAAPAAPILAVSAGFAHVEAGYSFHHSWKPHLAVEYDWASGDKGGGKYNRFDTLFGYRRGDFSPSGIYSAILRANISTPGLRLEVEPTGRLDAMVHASLMWLASPTDSFATTNVRDPSGRSGRYAGAQLDTRLRYWIMPKSLRLELTGVWLAKGRFLETAPNAPRTGDTTYAAAAVTAYF